jgi:hypothetical protein
VDLGVVSETNPKIPVESPGALVVTMPTAAAPASDFASVYTNDATYLASLEAAADNAFAGLATTMGTAFGQVETWTNALLVVLETADIVATS